MWQLEDMHTPKHEQTPNAVATTVARDNTEEQSQRTSMLQLWTATDSAYQCEQTLHMFSFSNHSCPHLFKDRKAYKSWQEQRSKGESTEEAKMGGVLLLACVISRDQSRRDYPAKAQDENAIASCATARAAPEQQFPVNVHTCE